MIISSDCIQLKAQAEVSQPPLAKKAAPLKAFFWLTQKRTLDSVKMVSMDRWLALPTDRKWPTAAFRGG